MGWEISSGLEEPTSRIRNAIHKEQTSTAFCCKAEWTSNRREGSGVEASVPIWNLLAVESTISLSIGKLEWLNWPRQAQAFRYLLNDGLSSEDLQRFFGRKSSGRKFRM
jgi:hypothetical protein